MNTFSKKFLSGPGSALPPAAFPILRRSLSSPDFLHKHLPCGNYYDPRKSGKCVEGCHLLLCQSHILSTAAEGCGKPLWKNLWRMWKTPSYQQVFCLFPMTPPAVENTGFPVFITQNSSDIRGVTSPSLRKKFPAERRIKCWNSVNFNCQSPGCPRLEREFFVEIQQILFPYQMSSTGNTFVVGLTPESSRGGLWQPSHSQEDSICRER